MCDLLKHAMRTETEFGRNMEFGCLYVSFADALNSFQGNGANPLIPTDHPGSSWEEETWSSHVTEAKTPSVCFAWID